MTEPAPTITCLTLIEAKPSASGVQLVARVSCRARGVVLVGLKLLRHPTGAYSVSNAVRGNTERGGAPRGVVIEDPEFRALIVAAAVVALKAKSLAITEATPRRYRAPRRA